MGSLDCLAQMKKCLHKARVEHYIVQKWGGGGGGEEIMP